MIEARNGRYRARYRAPDGRERSKTFDLKRDAADWLDSQRASLGAGAWVDPRHAKATFGSFADEWSGAQDQWKASTAEQWRSVRRRLESRAVWATPLGSVDALVLQRLRADLAQSYAPATVRLTMSYATMILRAAYRARRIGFDPTTALRSARGASDAVGPDDVPTRAEVVALIAAAPARFRAAVALGSAGLRVGEVLGLSVDRVDLAARRVRVDRQMSRVAGRMVLTSPKGYKSRTVALPALVAVELRRHVRDYEPVDMLFAGAKGAVLRRDTFYAQAWRPTLTAAGLAPDAYRFHALRHWCASTLLAEGAPLTAVAGHLGDTTETVTRTYAHWLRDDRDVPAAVLDRVLAPSESLPTFGSV